MDKLTRLLWLYSKLLKGEEVNKWSFCLEADCQGRSFDRDIEDIRIYLSETYQPGELRYRRSDNTYYLTSGQRHPLELMEYQFIQQLLAGIHLLRIDELQGLLSHLAENSQSPHQAMLEQKSVLEQYKEPLGCVPLLKMHSDLQQAISKQMVITLRCRTNENELKIETVLPCAVKYDSGLLYLVAFPSISMEANPFYYQIDSIESFIIERTQNANERYKVAMYHKNHTTDKTKEDSQNGQENSISAGNGKRGGSPQSGRTERKFLISTGDFLL